VKPVQIVIDEPLLRAVDREARRAKMNRSAVIREAIRNHLKRRRTSELEEEHRRGYERFPPTEFEIWDKVATWPEE
jgi:metal-responsive CopG/Arc/MetJ family transcriptional regulator